ncbi:hypothetical protein HDU86_002929 [Geranomyces michiganensis]|nr:hypothetical protein HDU86_002929 [Geranomyces michiganensis]
MSQSEGKVPLTGRLTNPSLLSTTAVNSLRRPFRSPLTPQASKSNSPTPTAVGQSASKVTSVSGRQSEKAAQIERARHRAHEVEAVRPGLGPLPAQQSYTALLGKEGLGSEYMDMYGGTAVNVQQHEKPPYEQHSFDRPEWSEQQFPTAELPPTPVPVPNHSPRAAPVTHRPVQHSQHSAQSAQTPPQSVGRASGPASRNSSFYEEPGQTRAVEETLGRGIEKWSEGDPEEASFLQAYSKASGTVATIHFPYVKLIILSTYIASSCYP